MLIAQKLQSSILNSSHENSITEGRTDIFNYRVSLLPMILHVFQMLPLTLYRESSIILSDVFTMLQLFQKKV